MKRTVNYFTGCLILGSLVATNAQATEGGGSNYPMGATDLLVGALPPPGVYPLIYAEHYKADDFKGNNGKSLPINFKLKADVVAPRLLYVTDKKMLGGQLFFAGLLPLVKLDVSMQGKRDKESGIGDLDLTTGLAFHHSPQLHSAVGVDVFAPTGEYRSSRLANPGRNYWTVEGVYAASKIDPAGINWGVKVMYDYNFKNDATNYKSGQELHADYSLGYGVAQHWIIGVGGYAYKQLTGDEKNGSDIGNKGQAFAIGPAIKYDNGNGFFLSAKYQKEMSVKNRPEGDALWIKTIVKF
ncbi:SphA family protein [Marinomonas spartinae]|uniref:SphA family protein n=1 Tax=Marinomonas spartinae TaxID=1792290 RepID=UPI0018F25DBE|nr:transporter [Marinomonas spartinae]MBJ7555987.1 transporter [Marinomonas spartinae]